MSFYKCFVDWLVWNFPKFSIYYHPKPIYFLAWTSKLWFRDWFGLLFFLITFKVSANVRSDEKSLSQWFSCTHSKILFFLLHLHTKGGCVKQEMWVILPFKDLLFETGGDGTNAPKFFELVTLFQKQFL
jgi:hypothetical protein